MKHLIAIAAVLGLAGTSSACGTTNTSPTATAAPTSAATAPATATATGRGVATNACQANPDPANPAQLVVTQPVAYAQVSGPSLTASGTINAFEATFQVSIKDASGADIVTNTGNAGTGQTMSPFTTVVPFAVTAPTPACLWVFQFSANTGNPSQIQQVPITLLP